MATPRCVFPGDTYLITRRCAHRTFRLRPCEETNAIFLYCLAFAARETGVLVHAVCVMSDHHHVVVTDPNGVLPDFLRELHRLTAKALNARQGQWENFWAAEPCNVVRLATNEDIEDKIAYVAANPVAAGLVDEPHRWPGVLAWGESVREVQRPEVYFRKDGTCPAQLLLTIERPPVRDGVVEPSARVWMEKMKRAIAAKVALAHRALRMKGRVVLGSARASTVAIERRATSYEKRFGIIPTFSAGVASVRERLRRVERHFRMQYRAALELWRGGMRKVPFPFGTWGMVVGHSVAVAAPLTA
jgi:putative transposase